jgi:hypothetical protein
MPASRAPADSEPAAEAIRAIVSTIGRCDSFS